MSRTLSPSTRSFAIAFLVVSTLLGPGCGSENESDPGNRPPTAQLTAGPVEGDTTNYQVRLFWTGSDPDGYVAAYAIAVDPPEDPAGVEWERTTDFSRLFRFSTPEAESTGNGSTEWPTGRFHGMHAVYLRAIDDEGAMSEPVRIAVTAQSVAPVTTIALPNISASLLTIGSALRVSWSGEDIDPAGAGPLRYEYKLIYLNKLVPPISVIRVLDPSGILFRPDTGPWVPMGDSLSVRLSLDVPAQCVLAVRATNAAGATEPFFDWGRNAFKFQAFNMAGVPALTVAWESGAYTFMGLDSEFTVATFAGTDPRFTVSASAEAYGEEIAGWRWGVNLADVESGEGWSPWTLDPVLPPLSIANPGVNILYVEARDTAGGLTRGRLILQVYDAPLDRSILWVDDSRDTSYPSDAQHDEFWTSLFRDSDRFDMEIDFFKYEVHGASDSYSTYPIPPTLEQLGRYRTIVWECKGAGYNGRSGLLFLTTLTPCLGVYLRAGGQLWVDGAMTVAAMDSRNGVFADLNYPMDVAMRPTSFAYRYMKLASSRIMNAKGVPSTDNMVGVRPFPGRAETYPQMDQDPGKVSPFTLSITHGDVILDPIYLQDTGLTGVLDSLYVYQAKSSGSVYDKKLNAVRWHDPDPAREHGRTQWFGFPLYYMKKDQAQETFNRAIDWFREEVRPAGTDAAVRTSPP